MTRATPAKTTAPKPADPRVTELAAEVKQLRERLTEIDAKPAAAPTNHGEQIQDLHDEVEELRDEVKELRKRLDQADRDRTADEDGRKQDGGPETTTARPDDLAPAQLFVDPDGSYWVVGAVPTIDTAPTYRRI